MRSENLPPEQAFQRFATNMAKMLHAVESPQFPTWDWTATPEESTLVRLRTFVTITDLTRPEIIATRGVQPLLGYADFDLPTRFAAIPAPYAQVVFEYERSVCALALCNRTIFSRLQNGASFDISYPILSANGSLCRVHQSTQFLFNTKQQLWGAFNYCLLVRDYYDPIVKGEFVDKLTVLQAESVLLQHWIAAALSELLNFTSRELEICHYLLKGYSNEGVAQTLYSRTHQVDGFAKPLNNHCISKNTVIKHTQNITRKGKQFFRYSTINSASDVALLLYRHGLVREEESWLKRLQQDE